MKSAARKIVQVPIEEDLLQQIDTSAGARAESRATFIREACKLRLKNLTTAELDRRYIEGYRRIPEDTAWAEIGATLLAQVLPTEKW